MHLDSPFRGLGRRDPDLAQQLRDASLTALRRLVDEAIERSCHFVVVAGDVYDGLRRGARAQVALRRAAERLDAAGIHLVLLHGNHDPLDEGYTAVRVWPERTHLLASDAAETVRLSTDAGPVSITGRSYPQKKVFENLAAGYPEPQGPGLHVAMLHTELDAHGGEHPYSPCTVADLVAQPFHYWALGHVHDQRVLSRHPLVAFPGNLQGRSFGEEGVRGALFVQGPPDALVVEALPVAPIAFHRVACDVAGLADLDAVVAALVAGAPEPEGVVRLLRAEISGSSVDYRGLRDVPVEEWLRMLTDRSGDGVRWMDVRVDVRSAVDLELVAKGPTLAGALIQRADDWADVRERLAGHAVLRSFAEELSVEDLRALMQRALHRAVDAVHDVEAEDGR
ncbi:MAG: DNA repair exonuclease [Myxococcales bacterium]|nr:DNA repair exonuclease [Myxococcales bacterium]